MSERRIGYRPGSTPDNNVISYIEDHLKHFPQRQALLWAKPGSLNSWGKSAHDALPHDNIGFADFTKRIRRFAQGLLDLGIRKGDRVIIFLPMGVDMYTAMFGVQRIGAIAVFLDSWARSHHLGASAECVDPKAMISSKPAFDLIAAVPEFSKMPHRILWGPGEGFPTRFDDLLKAKTDAPVEPVESEFTALITFTTGSSGKPKGANRTHRFLSAQHEALSKVIPYLPEDRDLPAFPIFSLNNLASGVTTVLPGLDLARPSEHDSAILASQIINEKVSCATLSPSMLVNLAKHAHEKKFKLPGLRRVVTGGAPISKDDVASFAAIAPNAAIWVLYGSTEVEPMAHIEGKEMIALAERTQEDPEILEEGVNVGEISEDLEYKFIRIRHDAIDLKKDSWKDLEVPRGEVGEFIVTGDHVCRDYYNNPEAFKNTKILDERNRVWHRTGDLAYIDGHKHLWMVGRIHNAIERGDRYYFPVRPEVLLKRMPLVEQAAFLGMTDPKLKQRTAVVVKVKTGADPAAVRREVDRIFAKNKIPVDDLFIVDQVPMDPRHHSKVEYSILRESLEKGQGRRVP